MSNQDPQSPFHDGTFPIVEENGEAHASDHVTHTGSLARAESNRSRSSNAPEFGTPRRSATAGPTASPHSAARTDSPANRNRGHSLITGAVRPQIDTNVVRSPLARSPLARGNTREDDHMEGILEEGGHPRARRSMASEREQSIAAVLRQASVMRQRAGTLSRRPRGSTMQSVRAPSIARSTGISAPRSLHGDDIDAQSFSLAGPDANVVVPVNQPFVQPGYAELNPAYEQQAQVVNSRPVWGLAKPLPRVIRPGMVPTVSELRQNIEQAQPSQRADDRPGEEIDLEKGRSAEKLPLRKINSRIEEARERRESRLLERLTSIIPDHSPAHDGILTPPNELAEADYFGEEDIGLARPTTGQMSSNPRYSTTATEPFVPYEDDSASTIHEDKEHPDITDEDWLDHELINLDPHNVIDELHNHHTQWSVIRTRYREPFAECLAVTVQLTLGFCADLVVTTSPNPSGYGATTAWAWGLATMIGIYIAGGISGAHMNPAISIMLYIYRGFPLRKVPVYIFAQLLGAFFAGLLAYGLYRHNIIEYGGAILSAGGTMNDFITNPRFEYIDAATAWFNEFVGTVFLAIAVMALGDDSNAPPGAGMSAFIVGLVVTVLSIAFSNNTGAALNGTRDLGPRLALLCVGYGGGMFRNWWWVCGPWLATISGAIVGAGVYDILIFVGGESPINYPQRRMKRAAHKWKKRTGQRIKRAKRTMKGEKADL